MRHLTIRLIAAAAVAAISLPAYAQSPIQLRFNVQPNAADAIWQSFKGVALEKEAECFYSAETSAPKIWNAPRGGVFKGKTVLFNPGFSSWDGKKQVFAPNTNDDGFNTLFLLPVGANAQSKSIVCRARILANGQNVTANQNDFTFALTSDIAAKGPPTAVVKLDASKVAIPTKEISILEVRINDANAKINSPGATLKVSRKQLEKLQIAGWGCYDKPTPVKGVTVEPGCFVNIELVVKRDSKFGQAQSHAFIKTAPNATKIWESVGAIVTFVSGADTSAFSGVIFIKNKAGPNATEFCENAMRGEAKPHPAQAAIKTGTLDFKVCVTK
jgi:hypothetical protein